MDGRDDNLFSGLEAFIQGGGILRPCDGVVQTFECLDVVPDLLVEIHTVSDYNHRVHDVLVIFHKRYELIGQPGDGIRFAGPGAVLNEEALPHRVLSGGCKKLADAVQLMVARPDDALFFLAGLRVFFYHDLSIVFDDVGQRQLRKNIFPEVGCSHAFWVDRIAGAAVHAFVERKEPAGFTAETGAHHDVVIVHGEVDCAALEREDRVFRAAVLPVLSHGILHVLTCVVVLEFEGRYRETVDAYAYVHGVVGIEDAVMHLADDTEDVLSVHLQRKWIEFRRQRIVHIEKTAVETVSLTEKVCDPAPGDFVLEPAEKLVALARGDEAHRCGHLVGLCVADETLHAAIIQCVVLVVVLAPSLFVAMAVAKKVHHYGLKTFFGCVCVRHRLYFFVLYVYLTCHHV